jgi:hypothetical protein
LSPSASGVSSVKADAPARSGVPTPLELGKKLLEAARDGLEDECRNLMAKGAPFTTDWVKLPVLKLKLVFQRLISVGN